MFLYIVILCVFLLQSVLLFAPCLQSYVFVDHRYFREGLVAWLIIAKLWCAGAWYRVCHRPTVCASYPCIKTAMAMTNPNEI